MRSFNLDNAFNYINVIYSGIESSHAFLQRKFPATFHASRLAEKFFFYCDSFALAASLINFEWKWQNRKVKMMASSNVEKSKSNWIDTCKTVARHIGLLGLSAATVYGINRWTKPSLNLQTLFKGILSPNVRIAVDWKNPLSQYVKQWVLASRIFIHLGTACLSSTGRVYDLTSAALQTLSLLNLSQTKYLTLTRTDSNYPLKSIAFDAVKGKETADYYSEMIEKLESKFYWKICGGKMNHPSYLESVIEEIEKYSRNYFQNSSWSSYWKEYTKNSIEYLRKLVYQVKIKATSPLLKATPQPILVKVEARAYGKFEWRNYLKSLISKTAWWDVKFK